MLSLPPSTRVPFGTLQVGGQAVELFISPEWARYLQSLNAQVVANAQALAESRAHTALLGDGGDMPEVFPGPPGKQGEQGAAGMALFMQQDDVVDQMAPVPPCIEGVYVPLNTKDAPNGVPGLTQLKLNLRNAANTVTSWITNAATAARTWIMQDKDGTVALLENFAAPPAIGNTTPAAGSFTALNATTAPITDPTTGFTASFNTNGTNAVSVQFGADEVTGYSWQRTFQKNIGAVPHRIYCHNTHVATYSTAGMKVEAGFGCNGKGAQPAAASGGTLAGVIAALVANGILSS